MKNEDGLLACSRLCMQKKIPCIHKECRLWIEHKDEQKIITRMKKMRKNGMSFRSISDDLERGGIRMTHMTVSNILRDEEKNKLKTRRVKEKIKSSFHQALNGYL